MSYILGLDASYAQGGGIDFNQAKAAGYEFWFQRMTYAYPGSGCKFDTTATTNYYGAKNAGFVVGGYHKVGWTDPIAEADFFVNAMSPLEENDILAYDKEPASDCPIPTNWSAWEQTFVKRVHDRTGLWPLNYQNISMFNTMPPQGEVQNCAPWVAAPSFGWDDTLPVNVPVMFQQGPTVHVPGISANVVDTNAFFGSIDQLKAYGYHTTPAPVETPPAPAPEPTPEPTPAPTPPPTPEPGPSPEPPKVIVPADPHNYYPALLLLISFFKAIWRKLSK